MEKTKHTPGPWDRQNKGNVIGPSARHEVVAGINKDGSKYLPTICRMPGLSDEDYANACLIAAAPDLLKACRELWFAIQVIPVDWNNPEAKELSEKAIDAIEEAEIAMNRAEGRE